MKLRNKILSLVLVLLTLFSVVGCGYESSKQENHQKDNNVSLCSTPVARRVINYQIKSDKTKYSYGEEATIEFLFNVNIRKDGNTYCVKIKESPYYEIVGENMVYTDGLDEPIEGEYLYTYHYKVEFKIRITEEAMGTGAHAPNIVVNRVGDENWQSGVMDSLISEYSGDPEFPWGNILPTEFGFTADEDGVEFTDFYTTHPKPKEPPTLFERIQDFFTTIVRTIVKLFQYIFEYFF